MIQRTYTLTGINRAALDHQLAQALGAVYGGFADRAASDAVNTVNVTVSLSNAATKADYDTLDALMAAHDPQQLTPEQQAEKEQQQKLTAARRDFKGADLNPAEFTGETAQVQVLARKVAWLEQEIASLRGE